MEKAAGNEPAKPKSDHQAADNDGHHTRNMLKSGLEPRKESCTRRSYSDVEPSAQAIHPVSCSARKRKCEKGKGEAGEKKSRKGRVERKGARRRAQEIDLFKHLLDSTRKWVARLPARRSRALAGSSGSK